MHQDEEAGELILVVVPIEEEVSDCSHPGRGSCRQYCLQTLRINRSDLAEGLAIPDSYPRKIELSLSEC